MQRQPWSSLVVSPPPSFNRFLLPRQSRRRRRHGGGGGGRHCLSPVVRSPSTLCLARAIRHLLARAAIRRFKRRRLGVAAAARGPVISSCR